MVYQPESNGDPKQAGAAGPDSLSGRKLFKCGICSREFDVGSSPFRPFCSQRCQQVDLGKWLNESYGLPWEDSAVPETATGIEDDNAD